MPATLNCHSLIQRRDQGIIIIIMCIHNYTVLQWSGKKTLKKLTKNRDHMLLTKYPVHHS